MEQRRKQMETALGKMPASKALAVMRVASQQWNLRMCNPANWGTLKRIVIHSSLNN